MTTQQIADRADIAIGTLYLYAATKAELLIMVQNQRRRRPHPGAGRCGSLAPQYDRNAQ
ncbi:TetR family transcriptional regulator [Arthrobacter sp. D1-29]